jgi:hypothetical protein
MMKTTEIVNRGAVTDPNMTELLDQLDPAIGEASSVMGAMATELIRRSLRGGVLQIGRELNGYVAQQVEQQIVEQRPVIEKTAAETATEVARGEVEAVRHAVQEQERQLAGRIDETSRQAQEQVQTIARDLTGRLDETTRHTHERIETVAKTADDAARQTMETSATLVQTLHTEVAAAQTRTLDSARQELESFKERARETTHKIKFRLDRLDAKSDELAELQRGMKQELLDAWRKERQALVTQIEELRHARASLAERLEALEQPRGLRRLFAWLFGKKKPATQADAD